MKTNIHFQSISLTSSENENFLHTKAEKMKTHILYSITIFRKSCR